MIRAPCLYDETPTLLNIEETGLEGKKTADSDRGENSANESVFDARLNHEVAAFFLGATVICQSKSTLDAEAESSGCLGSGLEPDEDDKGRWTAV